jgi:hypothetical protein
VVISGCAWTRFPLLFLYLTALHSLGIHRPKRLRRQTALAQGDGESRNGVEPACEITRLHLLLLSGSNRRLGLTVRPTISSTNRSHSPSNLKHTKKLIVTSIACHLGHGCTHVPLYRQPDPAGKAGESNFTAEAALRSPPWPGCELEPQGAQRE